MLSHNHNANSSGSITIYLALTITIITSLIFCVIESARITSIKVRSKAVTYSALDSSFSHFALQLFEEYGIFGVFTTEDEFLSLIKNYASKNCNPDNILSLSSFNLIQSNIDNLKYNNIYHLTDNDGLIFASQAIAYEKYRASSDFISGITGLENALNSTNTKSPGSINNGTIMVTGDDINNISALSKSSDLYKDTPADDALTLKNDIVSKITGLLKSNLLLFFIDNPSDISDIELSEETLSKFPSHTCILSSNITSQNTDIQTANTPISDTISETVSSAIDNGLFISWINHSFSSYFEEINSDLSLKYQREYLLCGGSSDNNNLLSAALSLVNLRAGFNFTYLFGNSEKRGAAFNLAHTMFAGTPIASDLTAFIILSAWSYAESILDVRDLFDGKKVPLIKSDDTWTLSLENILSLNKDTASNNSGEEGYSYNDYLNMALFLTSPYTLYFRAMDLIQLDICENCNPDFLIAACISGVSVNVTYSAGPLFTNIIKVASPEAYEYNFDMVYGYD